MRKYELCSYPEDSKSNSQLYIRLKCKNMDNNCRSGVTIRNLLIKLDSHESIVSNILDLTDNLVPID